MIDLPNSNLNFSAISNLPIEQQVKQFNLEYLNILEKELKALKDVGNSSKKLQKDLEFIVKCRQAINNSDELPVEELIGAPLPNRWPNFRNGELVLVNPAENIAMKGFSSSRVYESVDKAKSLDQFLENLRIADSSSNTYARELSINQGDDLYNYHFIDFAKMESYIQNTESFTDVILAQQMNSKYYNSFDTFIDYTINQYSRRLPLTDSELKSLKEGSTALRERTRIITHSKTPNHASDGRSIVEGFNGKYNVNSDFTFNSGGALDMDGELAIVKSSDATQQLPMELFSGHKVARQPEETIVEVGRFTVDRSAPRGLSNDMLKSVSSYIAQDPSIDKVVVYADAVHERLYRRLGFQVVESLDNGYHVLEVTPERLLQATN